MAKAVNSQIPAAAPDRNEIRGGEMSGQGLVSIRVGSAFLTRLREVAKQHSLTFHQLARVALARIAKLSASELRNLAEPAHEGGGSHRLSVYLGEDGKAMLLQAKNKSGLSATQILTRALVAACPPAKPPSSPSSVQQKAGTTPEETSLLWILVAVAIPIVGMFFSGFPASVQQWRQE